MTYGGTKRGASSPYRPELQPNCSPLWGSVGELWHAF